LAEDLRLLQGLLHLLLLLLLFECGLLFPTHHEWRLAIVRFLGVVSGAAGLLRVIVEGRSGHHLRWLLAMLHRAIHIILRSRSIHIPQSILPKSIALTAQLSINGGAHLLLLSALIIQIRRIASYIAALPHVVCLWWSHTIVLVSLVDTLTRHSPPLLLHYLTCPHHPWKVLAPLVVHTLIHTLCWHMAAIAAHPLPIPSHSIQMFKICL